MEKMEFAPVIIDSFDENDLKERNIMQAILEDGISQEEARDIICNHRYILHLGCHSMKEVARQYCLAALDLVDFDNVKKIFGDTFIIDNIVEYLDYEAIGKDLDAVGIFLPVLDNKTEYVVDYVEIFR